MFRIEYRIHPKDDRELWANFENSKKMAHEVALSLLQSLRDDQGHTKAQVWVNGHRINYKPAEPMSVYEEEFFDIEIEDEDED